MKTSEVDNDSELNNDNNVSTSKRSMLKAAWVAPVVVAISLPRSGYAANISGAHRHGKPDHDKNPKYKDGSDVPRK